METSGLDLHGLTWPEALEAFEAECRRGLARSNGSPIKIPVIHGYGSTGPGGVLRDRLRAFCRRFSERLEFTPGEAIDGNRGVTVVRVLRAPPDETERLAEEVHQYRGRPRTKRQLDGRFRRHGTPCVNAAMQLLKKQGRLAKVRNKQGRIVHEAR